MKNTFKKGLLATTAVAAVIGQQMAFAALDAGVTAELESAKTDAVAIGGIVLAVIVAIAAFKYLRRAL